MNALLIYNNNISQQIVNQFEDTCGKTIPFNIGYQEIANPNFSFDKKVTDILNQFENQEFEVIFIPFSLSEENYIEFLGLQFAYHIRLTQSFNNTLTPIVFFGNESPENINKITNSGSILFTPGVYCTTNSNVLDFEKQIKYILENKPKISKEEYNNIFLERINVQPPANYSTHHSIANEWSILRWAKAMKINDEEIKNVEEKIGHSLYFKFLKTKYPITEASSISNKILLNSGKILLIDDEIEKGWGVIFKHICRNKSFDTFGKDFKNWDKSKIIENSLKEIEIADVVILDLRLHDDDFEALSINEISGFQILKKIKEYNKGIQVIVFSATNKIWNLLELQKDDFIIDGFILKESPQNSIDALFTKNSINKIYDTIEHCLNRSHLKNLYIRLRDIKTNLNKLSTVYDETFLSEIHVLLDQSFDMHYNAKDDKQNAYAYITLYMIIEILNKEFVKKDEDQYWTIDGDELKEWKRSDRVIDFVQSDKKDRSEANKILGIAIQKLNLEPTNSILLTTNSCVTRRSVFIHPKATNKDGALMNSDGKIYTKVGFIELFNLIELLLNNLK
jgi:hypothetical protein